MSKASEWVSKRDFFGRARGGLFGERPNRHIAIIVEYAGRQPGVMLDWKILPADTAIALARWILDTFGEAP